jgi:sugar porter (SP) family MFS transporter
MSQQSSSVQTSSEIQALGRNASVKSGPRDKKIEGIVQAKPNPSMFLAISTAMFGAIMFGLDQGNFGNVQSFESFQQDWCVGKFEENKDPFSCATRDSLPNAEHNSGWQNIFVLLGASLITIGAAFGGLTVGPYLTNRLGRRPCISGGSAMCLLGCLLASYLSFGVVEIFMVGRFLTGFGIGVCCFALPLYNSEMATPGIRGATGSLFQLNVVIGSFVATLVTLFDHDWKFGMLLPGIAGAFVMVAVWFTPESPRYAMGKDGYEAGVRILEKVRSGDVTKEAEEMHRQLSSEKNVAQVSYRDLFREPCLRKRVLIACWLQIAQQLTGVNAFLGYASTLFKDIGIDQPFIFNMIWNGVMIVGCIAGLLLVDSSVGGRRVQLLGATILMGPSLVLAGFGLSFSWPGIITMIMVCLYGVGFQLAWGTVPWIYPSEIFTMAEKEKAVSLAIFLQYAANAIVVVITPPIMTASPVATLFVFGVLNILNFVFVATCIKETKGVPLEEVPGLFGTSQQAKVIEP